MFAYIVNHLANYLCIIKHKSNELEKQL